MEKQDKTIYSFTSSVDVYQPDLRNFYLVHGPVVVVRPRGHGGVSVEEEGFRSGQLHRVRDLNEAAAESRSRTARVLGIQLLGFRSCPPSAYSGCGCGGAQISFGHRHGKGNQRIRCDVLIEVRNYILKFLHLHVHTYKIRMSMKISCYRTCMDVSRSLS